MFFAYFSSDNTGFNISLFTYFLHNLHPWLSYWPTPNAFQWFTSCSKWSVSNVLNQPMTVRAFVIILLKLNALGYNWDLVTCESKLKFWNNNLENLNIPMKKAPENFKSVLIKFDEPKSRKRVNSFTNLAIFLLFSHRFCFIAYYQPSKLILLLQRKKNRRANGKHHKTIFFQRESNWFRFFTCHLSLPQMKLACFSHILFILLLSYSYLQAIWAGKSFCWS